MAKSANVHIIVGNDEALVRQRATETVTRLVGPQPDDFAFDVYEEGESGPTPALGADAALSGRSEDGVAQALQRTGRRVFQEFGCG